MNGLQDRPDLSELDAEDLAPIERRMRDWPESWCDIARSLYITLAFAGEAPMEQQEAAVNYQKTVLNAWKEIDEALSAYAAAQQETAQLAARTRNTAEALRLVNARYKNGLTDYTAVLDARRRNVQAQQALAAAQGRLNTQFAALNKAVGNVPAKKI